LTLMMSLPCSRKYYVYVAKRSHVDEQFIDTYKRIGMAPFKEAVYA
jgi:hypothetical protein